MQTYDFPALVSFVAHPLPDESSYHFGARALRFVIVHRDPLGMDLITLRCADTAATIQLRQPHKDEPEINPIVFAAIKAAQDRIQLARRYLESQEQQQGARVPSSAPADTNDGGRLAPLTPPTTPLPPTMQRERVPVEINF